MPAAHTKSTANPYELRASRTGRKLTNRCHEFGQKVQSVREKWQGVAKLPSWRGGLVIVSTAGIPSSLCGLQLLITFGDDKKFGPRRPRLGEGLTRPRGCLPLHCGIASVPLRAWALVVLW
jgi:hypothetical protein